MTAHEKKPAHQAEGDAGLRVAAAELVVRSQIPGGNIAEFLAKCHEVYLWLSGSDPVVPKAE